MTTKKPKADSPESVTLESAFSFIDDDGVHHYWHEGHVETDADRIAMLIERKAPLKDGHE